jgi:nitroreductase
MDTFLTIASKRDTRSYAQQPLPEDAVERILEAGRVTGSARNRQEWRFHVLESSAARERAAEGVTRPSNLLGAPLAVVVTLYGNGGPFDAGRAAQAMMLGAANEGIVSCPNSVADQAVFEGLLELEDDEQAAIVLSFGFPVKERAVESRTPEQWLARAERRPLEELVRRV